MPRPVRGICRLGAHAPPTLSMLTPHCHAPHTVMLNAVKHPPPHPPIFPRGGFFALLRMTFLFCHPERPAAPAPARRERRLSRRILPRGILHFVQNDIQLSGVHRRHPGITSRISSRVCSSISSALPATGRRMNLCAPAAINSRRRARISSAPPTA